MKKLVILFAVIIMLTALTITGCKSANKDTADSTMVDSVKADTTVIK